MSSSSAVVVKPTSETRGVREFYTMLNQKAQARSAHFSLPDLIIRLRDGIRAPHALNVVTLFWYHLFLTDRQLYDRLKACDGEIGMRMTLCGKVQTAYYRGEKTIAICSELMPREFLEIVDAYIEHTDMQARAAGAV